MGPVVKDIYRALRGIYSPSLGFRVYGLDVNPPCSAPQRQTFPMGPHKNWKANLRLGEGPWLMLTQALFNNPVPLIGNIVGILIVRPLKGGGC